MRVKVLGALAALLMGVAAFVASPVVASGAGLPVPSLVVGVVTAQDTGLPLTGICVTVLGNDPSGIGGTTSTSTRTVAGLYVVAIKQPLGVYLSDCEPVRRYATVNQPITSTAPVVVVQSKMPVGGTLAGTVTDGSHAGAPYGSGCAYYLGPEAKTDASGHYSFNDLPAGSGTLSIYPCIDDNTAWSNCLSNSSINYPMCDPLFEQSTLTWDRRSVSVSNGATTVANAELVTGGEIDGMVTTTGGQPAPDVGVNLHGNWTGLPIGARMAVTDSTGHYRFTGLPAGTYSFDFRRLFGNQLFATSAPFTVGLGQVISGVDATGAP